MLIDIRHAEAESKSLENVSSKKIASPSTLRQRVKADRIAIALMFVAVIIYAIVNA